MTNIRSIIKAGCFTYHPLVGAFKRWLRGRKPSVILAFVWLNYTEGLLFALQHDINAARLPECRVPQTIDPYRSTMSVWSTEPVKAVYGGEELDPTPNDLFEFWEANHERDAV